jgi:transaldolase
MIKSGELYMRVTARGLRGVTSNPAIFQKAIGGSSDYNEQIQQLMHEGLTIHEIYERLIVTDIQEACDILRPVYNDTDAMGGYVSLEVSPYLAYDGEDATARAASRESSHREGQARLPELSEDLQ